MITMEFSNQDEILAKFANISDANMRHDVLDNFGGYLVDETQSRFDTETSPDGEKWQMSARARNDGGKTLSNTRLFHDSMTHIVSPDQLEVGSHHVAAAIHQFGGEIVPKTAKALAFRVGGDFIQVKKVTMPARAYLGITSQDEGEFQHIFEDHMMEALR